MATNPMQRQARNSFLLGMVLTLLIAAAVIALLVYQMKKLSDDLKLEQAQTREVYVLTQDLKSGQIITSDLFTKTKVKEAGTPANATEDVANMLREYSLCDKEGNEIKTDADKKLYMTIDNKKVQVVKEENGEYYRVDENGNKTFMETKQKELVAKVDMRAKTIITPSLIAKLEDFATDDVRVQEYNMLSLPTDLTTGDYVDIRLMLPTGQDYIVVSKKLVTVPKIGEDYMSDTIQLKMAEDEILTVSNAIVEAYQMEAAKLYVTKYVEAGTQGQATPTYVVNDDVANLIESDPNIVKEAMTALRNRYNANNGKIKDLRKYLNDNLTKYGEEEAIPAKVQESITSTRENRQQYLQSLVQTPIE